MLVGFPPFYSRDRNRLFENIKYAKLVVPTFVSPDASDLLTKLLQKNPKKRLGYGKNDAEEIKKHKFFKDIDWKKLYNK